MPYRFRSDSYYPTVLINIITPRPEITGGDLLVHFEVKAVRSEYKPNETSALGEVNQRMMTAFAVYQALDPPPTKEHIVEEAGSGKRFHINTILSNAGRSTIAHTIECEEMK